MSQVINSKEIKELFSQSGDVLVRPIHINHKNNIIISVFCVDGLVNSDLLDQTILRPISLDQGLKACMDEKSVLNYLLEGAAYHAFASETNDYELVLKGVMSGMAALLFDQEKKALLFDVRTFDKRSISEPSDEGVMKGAKDAFIEVMRTNTALIRRRIRSEYLVMEQMSVGKVSKTDLSIAYLSNVADMNTVNKLKDSLKNIDIDSISTPSFVEEFIVDNKKSIFPQAMYTQRPDRCCSNISDGRIGLIVDGIPFVYLLPCQLPMLMQSSDDYANNYIISSSLRIIRYLAMIGTILLPAFYIAVTTFQNQMLPVQLALSIQKAKLGVPFSSAIEVLGLLLAFEILIESGLRLPKTVGTAMSILGGLVVGQAAVSAQLVSPAVVVIVALSGIAGFTVPNQDLSSAIRIIRFGFAILASFAGFFGLMVGIILLVTHLCSLDNYGVAYLSPFVDIESMNHKDTLFRFPVKYFKMRPDGIADKNKRKQK